MALGCAVTDVKDVTEMAPLLFVPQLLFAGFFIATSEIPLMLRWCQWLCGIKYALNIILYVSFCYTIYCSSFLLSFLVCDVSVSLLSIYCCLLAFSDTT
jgi:hypothetical protein